MNYKKILSLIKKNKKEILSALYFESMGFLLCLIVLFALTGGKNYIKLYYELNKVIDTYETITKNYYGKIDKKELSDIAVTAMIDSMEDKYTNYSDEDEANDFLENVEGHYNGIGIAITNNKEGQIVVASVYEDSPAEKAGLKVNDIIIKIDDTSLIGKKTDDLVDYIKDNNSKKIKLKILRDDKEKEVTISTDEIAIPTVAGKIIDEENKIGYIKISLFSSSTESQFKRELESLEKKKIKCLVIDVRNNSGGYLNVVTNITSMFLAKGQIIYQLQDEAKVTKVKDKTKEKRTYPIALLTNRGSASASEILAGAIKESYSNGIVVGTNTYGKGTVQKTKKLKDGSMIKYTVQKWLTPKGKWVEDVGVAPTEYVELDNTKEDDIQLEKALELLKEKIK